MRVSEDSKEAEFHEGDEGAQDVHLGKGERLGEKGHLRDSDYETF